MNTHTRTHTHKPNNVTRAVVARQGLINALVLERCSTGKPLSCGTGLIQLSFIPVCLPRCFPSKCFNIPVKLHGGFAL